MTLGLSLLALMQGSTLMTTTVVASRLMKTQSARVDIAEYLKQCDSELAMMCKLQRDDAEALTDEQFCQQVPECEQCPMCSKAPLTPEKVNEWWLPETLEERWPEAPPGSLGKEKQGEASELNKGFQNAGNSCYMAAALQNLLHMPEVLKVVTNVDNIQPESNTESSITFENRKRLVLLLQDIKEIYERVEGTAVPTAITGEIRLRLMSVGLQVDSGTSQEDSSDVLFKITDAFPPELIPGFSKFEVNSVVRDCHPSSNPFLRIIPGDKEFAMSHFSYHDDGDCYSVPKIDPPSVAFRVMPERESGKIKIEYLLRRSTKMGSLNTADVRSLYDPEITWTRCNRQLELTPDLGTFDIERPLNERFCSTSSLGVKRHIFVDQRTVVVDDTQKMAVYQYDNVEDYIIPDTDHFMLRVGRYVNEGATGRGRQIRTELDIPANGVVKLSVTTSEGHTKPAKFKLKAFTIHSGGLGGGHWTAASRNANGKWIGLNDASVVPMGNAHAMAEVRRNGNFLAFERVADDHEEAPDEIVEEVELETTPIHEHDHAKNNPGAKEQTGAKTEEDENSVTSSHKGSLLALSLALAAAMLS